MTQPNAEQTPRSFAEQRFIETLQSGSSSLPNTPTAPVPSEPPVSADLVTEPVTPPVTVDPPSPTVVEPPPVEPSIETPPAEVIAEADDDFSTDFSDITSTPVEPTPAIADPSSPLGPEAPQWQHDAYARLQNDESITADDKKTLAELPPSAWDKARRWARDTKLLGRFRDKNVPINEVYDVFSRQSKERVAELEIEALNRLVNDPGERASEFAAKYPKVYTALLTNLITAHPDFVQNAMKAKGYVVAKAEPVNADSILNSIKQDDLWVNIEDTPLGDAIEEKIKALAAQAAQTADPEFQPASTEQVSDEDAQALYEQSHNAIRTVRDQHWLKAIGDGLAAQGIRPASPAETQKNPAAAYLKNVIYNVALHGLPGVIKRWDEHVTEWGNGRDGFKSTFSELQELLEEGDVDKFKDNAPSLNPYYYEFGTRRAQIPMIKKLYKFVESLISQNAPPPPPPDTTTTTSNDGSPTPPAPAETRYKTLSEKRFFERQASGSN